MSKKAGVGTIKGVGEKTEKLFEKIGVYTVDDLIHYYPRGYEIFGEPVPISEVEEGKVCTICGSVFGRVQVSPGKGRQITTAYLKDLTGTIKVIWFRMPFLRNTLGRKGAVVLRGRVVKKRDLRSGSPLSGKDQHHAACLWIDSRSDKQCSNQSTTSGIRTGAGTG